MVISVDGVLAKSTIPCPNVDRLNTDIKRVRNFLHIGFRVHALIGSLTKEITDERHLEVAGFESDAIAAHSVHCLVTRFILK